MYNIPVLSNLSWSVQNVTVNDNVFTLLGNRIYLEGTDDEGDIECTLNGTPMKLIFNPVSNNYILTDAAKRICPHVHHNYCQIVKCDKLKFICFIISKNGCSCILKTALHHDGILSPDKPGMVWDLVVYDKYGCAPTSFNGDRALHILNDKKYVGYKKFIVLQDENERFIKFINWTHNRKYNRFVNLALNRHDSFVEHIFLYPYMSKDVFYCDQHACSQGKHIAAIIGQLYKGNIERYNNEVEVVHLDDLKEWFGDTFGHPMLMNNIDSDADKLYKLEALNDSERESLERLLKNYPIDEYEKHQQRNTTA